MLYQAIKLHRAEHAARTTIHVWKVNMIRPAFRHWCAMYIVRLMLHRMPLFSELSNEVTPASRTTGRPTGRTIAFVPFSRTATPPSPAERRAPARHAKHANW